MSKKHPKVLEAEARIAAATQQQPAPAEPVVAEPALPVAAVPPASPARVTLPPDADPTASLRQKVSTLEGLLRTAEDRHRGEQAALRQQVDQQQATIQQLQADLETALRSPQNAPYKLPQEVVEAVGQDEADRIARVVNAVVTPQLEQLRQSTVGAVAGAVTPLQQQLQQQELARKQAAQREAASKAESFDAAVERAVPGWQNWAVGDNADHRFVTWLAQRDRRARRPYRELLTEARAEHDADGFVELLKEFLASLGVQPAVPASGHRLLPTGTAGGEGVPTVPTQPETLSIRWIDEMKAKVSKGKAKREEIAEFQSKLARLARGEIRAVA